MTDNQWRHDEAEIDGGFCGCEYPRLWPPRRHDAPDVWDGSAEDPYRFVCGTCGTPTESEPCAQHEAHGEVSG